MLEEAVVVGGCGGLEEMEVVEGGFGVVGAGAVEGVEVLEGGSQKRVGDAVEAGGAIGRGAEALSEGEGGVGRGEAILLLEVLRRKWAFAKLVFEVEGVGKFEGRVWPIVGRENGFGAKIGVKEGTCGGSGGVELV